MIMSQKNVMSDIYNKRKLTLFTRKWFEMLEKRLANSRRCSPVLEICLVYEKKKEFFMWHHGGVSHMY